MPLSADPEKRATQLANLRNAPAAPDGNQRAIKHGAYRAVLDAADLHEAEQRIFAALAEDAPVRDHGQLPAADTAAVRLLADVLVRLDDLRAYLRRRGIEDGKGRLRTSALDLERRLRIEAADHAAALGMTPRSRAALGLDLVRTSSLLGGGQDLSGLTDDELAEYRRLAAKAAGAVEGSVA
jgi:hypothetical protein